MRECTHINHVSSKSERVGGRPMRAPRTLWISRVHSGQSKHLKGFTPFGVRSVTVSHTQPPPRMFLGLHPECFLKIQENHIKHQVTLSPLRGWARVWRSVTIRHPLLRLHYFPLYLSLIFSTRLRNHTLGQISQALSLSFVPPNC